MSGDSVERAEQIMQLFPGSPSALIMRDLVGELKAAREEISRLQEFEWMYKELQ